MLLLLVSLQGLLSLAWLLLLMRLALLSRRFGGRLRGSLLDHPQEICTSQAPRRGHGRCRVVGQVGGATANICRAASAVVLLAGRGASHVSCG